MTTIFLFCAAIGGTILVCQFLLTLVGLGAEGADFAESLPDDLDIDIDSGGTHYDSTWLFSIISFRTVVAALAFFGLAGLGADSAGLPAATTLILAVACGMAAMMAVHYMMQLLNKLDADGTVRIERSVGKRGTVYVPIPGDRSGAGKVQIRMQGRIVEYQAMTAMSDRLPTGARVVVTGVIGPTTVDVEVVPEAVPVDGTA